MRVVVVGAGLAAVSAIEELRALGHEGSIDLVGQEEHVPYHRPPLSKAVLLGSADEGSTLVHDRQWYADNSVDLHLGTTVTRLDLDRSHIHVGDVEMEYDRLVLTTGASPRRLPAADASGAPVAYLRTIEDSRRLQTAFGAGRRIVIVGGGWIGLEVAAAARAAGSEVTVVESLDLPLLRVLGPEVATIFADLHRKHGVHLRLGATIEAIEAAASRQAYVHLLDGSVLNADLVVVGVGVEPNVSMAAAAGLAVDNGILVNERLRASDPHVFAAGDVANHLHPTLGRRLRVEHWDTAIHQGRAVARTMLGDDEAYTRLPYFFTDQYDLGMEYVGSVGPDGYDEVVVRGDPDRQLAAFWLSQGLVVAGMHLNDWDAIGPIRTLVGSAVAASRLGDESLDLATIAAGA